MQGDVDISTVAGLLASRARAAMCQLMMDGTAHPAGELARHAGIGASAASTHLSRLVDGGLVTVAQQGRQRCYRLAGPDVASALELLGSLGAPTRVVSLRGAGERDGLRAGRTCYDHLAGRLGVAVTEAFVARGVLDDDLALLDPSRLESLDLHTPNRRRPLVRACLDWTERVPHVAGALPAAFTTRLFELGWLRRPNRTRAAELTRRGEAGLWDLLGLDLARSAAATAR